jgi:tRNA threonylcarbamoyl adenosine modification protein YjeE
MSTIQVPDLGGYEALAASLLSALVAKPENSQATVIALAGELGAGKTTFVQVLARALGVREVVQSPTFSIFKIYPTANQSFKTLVHMDAYRIESLAELRPLRFAEILQSPQTLVCIEWAEQIAAALPESVVKINFAAAPSGAYGREVTVTGLELPSLPG